jgi:protein O-GlcNAc transferase
MSSPTHDLLVKAINLQNSGDAAQAEHIFKGVLVNEPNNGIALYSIAVLYLHSGLQEKAFEITSRGVVSAREFGPIHAVHASILHARGQKEEALKSYELTLSYDPNNQTALLNSGVILRELMRHQEAVARFNELLRVDPTNQTALANCAILLTEFKQSETAIGMFKRLLAINPEYDYGLGLLAYERLHICDWTDFESARNQILDKVRAGQRACKSLSIMALSDSAEDHMLAARTFANHYCLPQPISLWNGERYRHERIRVAYVSPDLREHPVGHLIAGVFERHDKTRFETIAISLGIDDGSRIRARMRASFDHFIDVKGMGSQQIAQLMRDMEVDIAVDLGGYTSDTRTEVFAFRPAPVQVNYLGYPGTMGSSYYDYILADPQIIPPEQQRFYTEKVVYLPDTYLPTDRSVQISERTPTRAECGLPEEAFVFCSFSHDYKINPPLFDTWMRLLSRVPDSVLWLMARGDLAQANLRKEAAARGVDPTRLVFAGRVPLVEDHLARYRQANLFLDTHPYNAHTTAADALMAGLPVLTYMGRSFPSRVAGSLLIALDVPELITHSPQEYEDLALTLANQPNQLKYLRDKVSENLVTQALFDTQSFCRNLEATLIAMWRRSQLGVARDGLGSPL